MMTLRERFEGDKQGDGSFKAARCLSGDLRIKIILYFRIVEEVMLVFQSCDSGGLSCLRNP